MRGLWRSPGVWRAVQSVGSYRQRCCWVLEVLLEVKHEAQGVLHAMAVVHEVVPQQATSEAAGVPLQASTSSADWAAMGQGRPGRPLATGLRHDCSRIT